MAMGKTVFNRGPFFKAAFLSGQWQSTGKIKRSQNQYLVAASQNRGPLKVFRLKKNQKLIQLAPLDVKAIVTYKNGKTLEQEFYYGTSFLSQSGRFIRVDDQVVSVEVIDSKGSRRKINL
jgi:hypothetical protein